MKSVFLFDKGYMQEYSVELYPQKNLVREIAAAS
jgi:hypothetical protein